MLSINSIRMYAMRRTAGSEEGKLHGRFDLIAHVVPHLACDSAVASELIRSRYLASSDGHSSA